MESMDVTVGRLVSELRETGAVRRWAGSPVVAQATAHVFGDRVVAALPSAERVDVFAIAVVTAWATSESGTDEYFAGTDLDLTRIDAGRLIGWGLPTTFLSRVREIVAAPGCPPAAVSLGAWIILGFEPADGFALRALDQAPAVLPARHGRRPVRRSHDEAAVVKATASAAEAAAWVRGHCAPETRRALLAPGGTTDPALAGNVLLVGLYLEFGRQALWSGPHADAMEAALTLTYPYSWGKAALGGAPLFDATPFSADEDAFFRQIVFGRLCTIWTARSGDGRGQPVLSYEALLPFAYYVAGRAVTERTHHLAVLLAELALPRARDKYQERERLAKVQRLANKEHFTRRLLGIVTPLAFPIAFIASFVCSALPDPLGKIAASAGVVGVVWLVSTERKAVGYENVMHSRVLSVFAAFPIALSYAAGLFCAEWVQFGKPYWYALPFEFLGFYFVLFYVGLSIRCAPARFRWPSARASLLS